MNLEVASACAEAMGWLSEQPVTFRKQLLRRCKLRALQIGDALYGLDDPPGGVFGLVDGFVDVLLAAGPNPPFLCHIGRPGWWVGEAAALTDTPRRVEVRARTKAQVLYLSPNALAELSEDDPISWKCFGALTVTHMDNALMLASTLAPGTVRSKVLATLLRLAGSMMNANEMIELPCKQSDISELTGLTRNSVGPIIRKLASEGLLVSSRNRIAYNPVRVRRSLGL